MAINRASALMIGLTAIAVMLESQAGVPAVQEAPNKAARTDLYGDPLPPGAISRFGTVRLRQPGEGGPLVFSLDNRQVISLSDTGEVLVWDAATGKLQSQLPGPLLSGAKCLTLSPDGKFLAASGGNYANHLWDLTTKKEPLVLEGHRGNVCALVFAPDSRTLISAATDKIIYEDDRFTRSRTIADRAIRLWDVATGKIIKTITDQPENIASLAILPDGKRLAIGGALGSVRVLNLDSNKVEQKLEEIKGSVHDLRVSPDGKSLTAGARLTQLAHAALKRVE
jgi:WD40 repeat protein